MKNQRSMYLIAKARAIAEGPKAYRMFRGYALTEAEVKKIYTREGFTKAQTIQNHIDIWKEAQWVEVLPVGNNKEPVLFFVMDDIDSEDRQRHQVLKTSYPDCQESLPGVMQA